MLSLISNRKAEPAIILDANWDGLDGRDGLSGSCLASVQCPCSEWPVGWLAINWFKLTVHVFNCKNMQGGARRRTMRVVPKTDLGLP